METVLGRFRKEKRVPSSEIINSLLLAADALKNLVANVETSDRIDISHPMEALNAIDWKPRLPQRRNTIRLRR